MTRITNDVLNGYPDDVRTGPDVQRSSSSSIDVLTQRLHDQQFYTRSLIESTMDAILTTDINGIITDVNKKMIDLSGRTRDELLGAPCRKLFSSPERADAMISHALSNENIRDYELIIRSFDESEVEMSFNASTLRDRERAVYGVFAVARDVTPTKKLERALRDQNAMLEETNAASKEYLKSAQIVLLEPLKRIIAESHTLASGCDGPLTDVQQSRINGIHAESAGLFSLLDDLLAMSRAGTGMVEMVYADTDVKQLLLAATTRNVPLVGGPISMSVHVADDLPAVSLDSARLHEILDVLLSNAVQASGDRGLIVVQARQVDQEVVGQISGSRPHFVSAQFMVPCERFLEISVSDSGIGIVQGELAEIFRPLRRVAMKRPDTFVGHGVALTTMKLLVEAQGGAVAVESTVGSGSTFTIWLPHRSE